MPDYTMADPVDDDVMEDLTELDSTYQANEDIDIDLEFNDDGQQDEKMVETDLFIDDYNAQIDEIGFDNDDEMADEGQPDQVGDQKIEDAPLDMAHTTLQNDASEVRMAEQPTPEPFNTGVPQDDLIDFDDDDIPILPQAQEDGAHLAADDNQSSVTEPSVIEATVSSSSGLNLVPEPASNALEEPTETEDAAEPLSAKAKEDFAVTKNEGGEIPHDLDSEITPAAEGKPVDATVSQSAAVTYTQTDEPSQSTSTLHESRQASSSGDLGEDVRRNPPQHDEATPEKHIQETNEQDNKENLDPDHETEGGQDDEQELAHEGEYLDDFHPISVKFNGQELSLFIPRSNEPSIMFLLSDYSLIEQDICALLHACRLVLGADIGEDEELIIALPALGLRISENAHEAATTSLVQLRDMFIHLCHNDGDESPAPLRLELTTQYKVSAQLNKLQLMIEEGQGLKDLVDETLTVEENPSDQTSTLEADVKDRSRDEPVESYAEKDDHFNAFQTEADDNKANGSYQRHPTPTLDDKDGEQDDFLDFRSPLRQPKADVTNRSRAESVPPLDEAPQVPRDFDATAGDDLAHQGEYFENDAGLLEGGDTEFDSLFPHEDATFDDSNARNAEGAQHSSRLDLLDSYVSDPVKASKTGGPKTEPLGTSHTRQGDETHPPIGNSPQLKVLLAEADWSPEDSNLNKETDSSSSNKPQAGLQDEINFPDDDNLDFDFDDYTNDHESSLDLNNAMTEGNTTFIKETVANTSTVDSSTDSVPTTSTTAKEVVGSAATKPEIAFDEDEIDFPSDDEETEQNDQKVESVSFSENVDPLQEKTESAKRSHSDEDVNTPDSSPSKFLIS